MLLEDLAKHLVSIGAPFIGNLIAGPAGAHILSWIANELGLTEVAPENIYNAIQNHPDNLDKIIQLNNTLVQENKISADDEANARQLQIELAKISQNNKAVQFALIVPPIIALSFIIIYFIIQLFVLYHPGETDDLISARVQDIIMLIIGFYFGNSFKHIKQGNNDVDKT